MHPKLQALAEGLVEFLVVILLLCNLCKHLQALLDQVLLDHSQDLVLLQGLARDVQRKILRIHNSLHEVQPFWHKLLAVIHDEHAANVELDVVSFLFGLKKIEGRPARHKKQGTELKLTLHAEMLHCKVILPVVGQGLVEVFRLAHPQGLVLVELLPLMRDFFNFLRFLFFSFSSSTSSIWVLLLALLHVQLYRKPNKLAVFLDQVLQTAFLEELGLVFLEVADNFCAAFDFAVHKLSVLLDSERSTCTTLPNVLFVVVVFADDADLVRDQVGTVEANAELSNHADVSSCSHGFHECLGSRLCNGAQVVDQLVLGHADAGVFNGQGGVGLIRNNLDEESILSGSVMDS
eukprot:Skav203224  [mRNA]  locus=scaffold2292:243446:246351:- [translate_table: standard]